MKILLLDNGHGIDTPGKRSPDSRLLEWQYTRRLAHALVGCIPHAQLLVPEETDIPLRERIRRVNAISERYGATNVNLVSLHVNAASDGSTWHNARGFMAIVSPGASPVSRSMAVRLQNRAAELGLQGNRALPPQGYWEQNLAICRDTKCAAVLTENLFQDNRTDVDRLLSSEGFNTLVNLYKSVLS